MEHTGPAGIPETPWTWEQCERDTGIGEGDIVGGAKLLDAHGKSVFTVDCGDYMGLSDESASLIVQAVNAHSSALTRDDVERFIDQRLVMQAQYADLVAALKVMDCPVCDWSIGTPPRDKDPCAFCGKARAALANAER